MPARAAANAAGVGSASMKKSKHEPVPVIDYRQYRRARRLIHECCNYDGSNYIALDDGEECVCVQSISYPCCAVCSGRRCCRRAGNWKQPCSTARTPSGVPFAGRCSPPGSNLAKYCPECAGRMRRIKDAQRKRKQRATSSTNA